MKKKHLFNYKSKKNPSPYFALKAEDSEGNRFYTLFKKPVSGKGSEFEKITFPSFKKFRLVTENLVFISGIEGMDYGAIYDIRMNMVLDGVISIEDNVFNGGIVFDGSNNDLPVPIKKVDEKGDVFMTYMNQHGELIGSYRIGDPSDGFSMTTRVRYDHCGVFHRLSKLAIVKNNIDGVMKYNIIDVEGNELLETPVDSISKRVNHYIVMDSVDGNFVYHYRDNNFKRLNEENFEIDPSDRGDMSSEEFLGAYLSFKRRYFNFIFDGIYNYVTGFKKIGEEYVLGLMEVSKDSELKLLPDCIRVVSVCRLRGIAAVILKEDVDNGRLTIIDIESGHPIVGDTFSSSVEFHDDIIVTKNYNEAEEENRYSIYAFRRDGLHILDLSYEEVDNETGDIRRATTVEFDSVSVLNGGLLRLTFVDGKEGYAELAYDESGNYIIGVSMLHSRRFDRVQPFRFKYPYNPSGSSKGLGFALCYDRIEDTKDKIFYIIDLEGYKICIGKHRKVKIEKFNTVELYNLHFDETYNPLLSLNLRYADDQAYDHIIATRKRDLPFHGMIVLTPNKDYDGTVGSDKYNLIYHNILHSIKREGSDVY